MRSTRLSAEFKQHHLNPALEKHFRTDAHNLLRLLCGGLLLFLLVTGLLTGVLGIDLLQVLPHQTICPFQIISGFPCPGCGIFRGLIALSQSRFSLALYFNPFAIPLLLSTLAYAIKPGYLQSIRNPWWFRIGLGIVLFVWVVRLQFPELGPN